MPARRSRACDQRPWRKPSTASRRAVPSSRRGFRAVRTPRPFLAVPAAKSGTEAPKLARRLAQKTCVRSPGGTRPVSMLPCIGESSRHPPAHSAMACRCWPPKRTKPWWGAPFHGMGLTPHQRMDRAASKLRQRCAWLHRGRVAACWQEFTARKPVAVSRRHSPEKVPRRKAPLPSQCPGLCRAYRCKHVGIISLSQCEEHQA